MIDLRKKKHLKRSKTKNGGVFYYYHPTKKCENHELSLSHLMEELSSPVIIKKAKKTTASRRKQSVRA